MIAAKRNSAIRIGRCFLHSGVPDRTNPSSGIKTSLAVVSTLVDRYNKRSKVADRERRFVVEHVHSRLPTKSAGLQRSRSAGFFAGKVQNVRSAGSVVRK